METTPGAELTPCPCGKSAGNLPFSCLECHRTAYAVDERGVVLTLYQVPGSGSAPLRTPWRAGAAAAAVALNGAPSIGAAPITGSPLFTTGGWLNPGWGREAGR